MVDFAGEAEMQEAMEHMRKVKAGERKRKELRRTTLRPTKLSKEKKKKIIERFRLPTHADLGNGYCACGAEMTDNHRWENFPHLPPL